MLVTGKPCAIKESGEYAMQTYNAPLRDMRFVLHELHDSASLASCPDSTK
jgi:hypothetical protein